jgi:hypothetical protein
VNERIVKWRALAIPVAKATKSALGRLLSRGLASAMLLAGLALLVLGVARINGPAAILTAGVILVLLGVLRAYLTGGSS